MCVCVCVCLCVCLFIHACVCAAFKKIVRTTFRMWMRDNDFLATGMPMPVMMELLTTRMAATTTGPAGDNSTSCT